VGLGQGGSAAAGRLAESGRFSVLGISPGGRTQRSLGGTDYVMPELYYDQNGKVQIGVPYTRFDVPIYTFAIDTNPTPYPDVTALVNGVETGVHVGAYLGGSAAHNGMIWSRHTKATINSWGVEGWSYDDVLPFYKKIENVTASIQSNYAQYHGLAGPIQISDIPNSSPFFSGTVENLLRSCLNLGYPYNPDFNGASRYGCGEQVFSIGRGVRYSAAHGYLPGVLADGRLQIELYATVTKILIKAGSGRGAEPVAYGVEYYQGGKYKRVYANKEIIVAASGIFTPKLLLQSGIGPAADLKKLGITVWVDSPNVGKNFQSNQVVSGSYNYPNAPFGSALSLLPGLIEYQFNGTGPWSATGHMVFAYVCSKTQGTCDDPDVMIGFMASDQWSANSNGNVLSTQVSNAKPQMRGSVTLISADPFALPNVTWHPLANQEDLDSQVFGWRLIRRLLSTPPASGIIGEEITPGPSVSDADLPQWVLGASVAGEHWTGSSKFGNAGDPTRVTDPQLRVVGISGLRIGDLSVFPSINSHGQCSAALAGERVADFILQQYSRK